jgi:threonine/homoserine/homoserine lactone efflux protein
MFDYSLLHWSTFLTAVVLLTVSPGPDIAFMLGQTVKGGTRKGLAAMFGVWMGAFTHIVMAALGLSAIIASSAIAFTAIKWVGAAYLIWLGIAALRSKGGSFIDDGAQLSASSTSVFLQGILISVLNPKVAVFFLAFLPQFIVPGAGPVWAQLLLHGALMIVVAAFIEPPFVLFSSRISKALRNNQKLAIWLDRSMGAVFVALGIRLATSDR